MKLTIIVLAAAAAAVGAFAAFRTGLKESISDRVIGIAMSAEANSPFACDIKALTPEQRKRHFEELSPQLRSLKKSVRELPDGYEFEFPADPNTFALVTEWSIQERQCCPFFDIDIRLDRDGGPLWLRLTGKEGTKDFIKSEAASWLK
jgi:hypothetical protein